MFICSCLLANTHNLHRAIPRIASNFASSSRSRLTHGSARRYLSRNMKKDERTNSYVALNVGDAKSNATILIRRHSSDARTPLKIQVPTAETKKSAYARLFALAKKEKWKLTGAVGLLILSSSVTMAVPFSLGKVLDIIYKSSDDVANARSQLNALCGTLVGVFCIGALCNFGRVYIMSTVGYRMTQRLRMQVFSSIIRQEQGFFDKRTTGELVNRLSADTQIVGQALSQNISDGLRSTIMVLAGTGMMFYMSYELALVGLAIVPPVTALAVLYGRYVRNISKKVQDVLAEASQVSEEKISNIRTVRTFGQEQREVELYQSKIKNVLEIGYKESKARALFYGMTGLSGNIIIISVLYYGGVMVSSETITVGHLSSFLLYAAYIGVSLGGLSSFYSELNKSIGAASRLWELIDREPLIPIKGGLTPIQIPHGDIEYRNIKFAYPSRPDICVFQDLNLKLAPGRTVAVVGPSGSGKSTVAALLLRLYDPDGGEVLLDGHNVKDLDPYWLRTNIGTVSQEPILFTTSIKDNILYGAEHPELITDEEFLKVAREANVEEFVSKLPDGYKTLVGERGVMLSGGQKQRVAIARALIKNPTILLLDEATSALDAQSEFLVQEALERIMKGRTVLTIAHRLSTIQNADSIAVLDNGVIVEQGTYNDLLMIKDGKFKELIKHQTFNSSTATVDEIGVPDILTISKDSVPKVASA